MVNRSLQKEYARIHAEDDQALRYGAKDTFARFEAEKRYRHGKKQSHSNLVHLAQQPTVDFIEERTESRYLASILDLIPDDVPMLEKLRDSTKAHLQRNYGITDNEIKNCDLYFHFPYPASTVTLHLHVRTKGNHIIDEARSFRIDDVIHALKARKSMTEMIMERQTHPDYDGMILHDKKNELGALFDACPTLKENTREIDNPKLMAPLLEEEASGSRP